MPQEFHVLRCFKCESFQVQIVKKVSKWQCKICEEKQSVRKVYGKGTGKDCRLHVQKLNTLRLEETLNKSFDNKHDENQLDADELSVRCESELQPAGVNNWAEFFDAKSDSENELKESKDSQYVLERPQSCKRRKRFEDTTEISTLLNVSSNSCNGEVQYEECKCKNIPSGNNSEELDQKPLQSENIFHHYSTTNDNSSNNLRCTETEPSEQVYSETAKSTIFESRVDEEVLYEILDLDL